MEPNHDIPCRRMPGEVQEPESAPRILGTNEERSIEVRPNAAADVFAQSTLHERSPADLVSELVKIVQVRFCQIEWCDRLNHFRTRFKEVYERVHIPYGVMQIQW